VNFQLQGPTSFTPNSGASIVSGYILTMGFLNIIGATEDILVVQQNPFYTTNTNDSFSGHIVTVSDYHLSNGALTADTITTDDLNAIGYMKSNNYSITVKRALSSHSG
jgi:peroxiredoxin